ncbi:diaminopimelate decarboxylase [Streptomyces cucumeris]|uniref:diaminopimelate decarboxylase n=1 Tax=Streptomyces cucumeris TaxID=2962890 RepID=UPI003D71EB3C
MVTPLLPDTGHPAPDPDDGPALWPASASLLAHGDLAVGGVPLTEVADRFGTPVQLLDEAEVRARCRAYQRAFPGAGVRYAATAFLCRAMAHWLEDEGLGLAVRSAGELESVFAGGFPPDRIVLHGTAESQRDLAVALRLGVGRIVIDSPQEIARLAAAVPAGSRQKVMVRVAPGIAAGGHATIRTGTGDRNPGLSLTDGSAHHAVARILDQPRLELVGLHCHLGSQITSGKPYLAAVRRLVGLMARVRELYRVVLPELDLGGGHAIAHRPGEPALDIAALARRVRTELTGGCAAAGLPVPRLLIEPGRAVVGPAGVALHRVVTVERTGEHAYVVVDGATGDSGRPAPYGVRAAPRLVGRRSSAPPAPVTVAGRHRGAGDVLGGGTELPADVHPGDLLAVPVAGAYHPAMAPGDHLAGRPPVVAVADGHARLLVRRESPADFRGRDIGP